MKVKLRNGQKKEMTPKEYNDYLYRSSVRIIKKYKNKWVYSPTRESQLTK